MTTFSVTHRTEYRYDRPVSASYGELRQLPREIPGRQRCLASDISVSPPPRELSRRLDYFGNPCAYYHVEARHELLQVVTTSTVEVTAPPWPTDVRGPAWEAARDAIAAGRGDGLAVQEAVLDSPRVAASEALAAYALDSFAGSRPLRDALRDLCSRIHREFEFEPGATSVHTTVDEVLASRAGVCQDFAQLMIGCVRSLGLPARYVSGYLETTPPPGSPRLTGADVSHAWVAAHVPEVGWVELDPTNDTVVDDRYVIAGWGRDYSDVTPLKGVIYTDATSQDLTVEVDVVRLSSAPDPSG